MELDTYFLIPVLSDELNLLGYPKLPYKVKKSRIKKFTPIKSKSEESVSDFSDTDAKEVETVGRVVSFNNKEMITKLVSICFELVKDVKSLNHAEEQELEDYNRIKFDNGKLQKYVHSLEKVVEQNTRTLKEKNEECRQLKAKLMLFESKIKTLQKEKQTIMKQNESNLNLMKHKQKKVDKSVDQLHKILYKNFNVLDVDYLPQNFEILNTRQPDFNNLWSTAKYSSRSSREDALKKAVCIFQHNNEFLMEENATLKTLLLVTVEEINTLVHYISQKMNLHIPKIDEKGLKKVFLLDGNFCIEMFRNCITECFSAFLGIAQCFEKYSFIIGESIFVCLTDVIKQAGLSMKEGRFVT